MKSVGLLVILFFLSFGCARQNESRGDRISRLGSGLRCPVCRGVPISESPAELARKMMDEVAEQVDAGKSDEAVLRYFEERYGEWALLEPKPEGMNLMIWILPALILIGGAATIIHRTRRSTVSQEDQS